MEHEISEYEKRREGRLDRYLDHLNPDVNRELEPKDEYYFSQMSKAHHLLCTFLSPADVHKVIMEQGKFEGGEYSPSMAYQLIADSHIVFGDAKKMRKDALRNILTEHLFKANQYVLKDKSSSGAEKAEIVGRNADRLAKLHNLYSNTLELTPDQIMPAVTYNFVVQEGGSVEINAQKNVQNNEG